MTGAVRALAAVALLVAAPASAAKRALAAGERVDLNRATVSELMRLPGIGERKAQAIVAHRQRSPFRRPEDVLKVKGLGRGWLQRVKGHLVAGPPERHAAAPAVPAAASR